MTTDAGKKAQWKRHNAAGGENLILVIDIGNITIAFTGLLQRNPVKNGTGVADLQVLFEKKLPTSSGRDVETFLGKAREILRDLVCRPEAGALFGDAPVRPPEDRDLRVEAGYPSAGLPSAVELVSISSVVPACTPAAIALAEKLCSLPPVVISCGCDTGLSFDRLPAPEKVGADRIADAAWAAAAYPLPAMTVDLGTATTINVIGVPETGDRGGSAEPFQPQSGVFLGGMIGSGVRTSLQALRTGTAQLPALDPVPVSPDDLIGRDTDGCMLSAAVVGTASMIEGLAERVEELLGAGSLSLILTGGNAAPVAEWIRRRHDHEPALAAKGAALIALRQTRQAAQA